MVFASTSEIFQSFETSWETSNEISKSNGKMSLFLNQNMSLCAVTRTTKLALEELKFNLLMFF